MNSPVWVMYTFKRLLKNQANVIFANTLLDIVF